MRECVIIDGVRSANSRAHADKGWFRSIRPDEVLTKVYDGLFARNPKVKPEDIESVFVGCANITGMQNDIGRISWLAGGFPESVPTNTLTMQCPSGMAATSAGVGGRTLNTRSEWAQSCAASASTVAPAAR